MFKKIKNEKGSSALDSFLVSLVVGLIFAVPMLYLVSETEDGLILKEVEEKIEIKALSDNAEINGEISGGLTFIDGEINENTYYRLELFDPKSKLAMSHKLPATSTKKYLDIKEDEKPYILLKIEKHIYEENTDGIVKAKNRIPKIYLNFLPKDYSGVLKEAELHLPENSIRDYIKIDTE